MKRRGPLALIIAGVLANNYVLLHDVIWDKYSDYWIEGSHQVIALGPRSWAGIIFCLIVIAAGIWWADRVIGQKSGG
jgi:hypothetical protein